jgi:hypothetical protein
MSLIVKVVLARIPGTWEIERQAPMQVFTRTALLGFYDPHPEVLGQIEGAGQAFFEADWKGETLDIGRRVEDRNW